MTQQYVPNLFELCNDNDKRDAVHIAVAPVKAGQDLHPGEHVVLVDGWAMSGHHVKTPSIGIVSPFLKTFVRRGERFWLILYPGTVTSLRHVWTHPDFKAKIPGVEA